MDAETFLQTQFCDEYAANLIYGAYPDVGFMQLTASPWQKKKDVLEFDPKNGCGIQYFSDKPITAFHAQWAAFLKSQTNPLFQLLPTKVELGSTKWDTISLTSETLESAFNDIGSMATHNGVQWETDMSDDMKADHKRDALTMAFLLLPFAYQRCSTDSSPASISQQMAALFVERFPVYNGSEAFRAERIDSENSVVPYLFYTVERVKIAKPWEGLPDNASTVDKLMAAGLSLVLTSNRLVKNVGTSGTPEWAKLTNNSKMEVLVKTPDGASVTAGKTKVRIHWEDTTDKKKVAYVSSEFGVHCYVFDVANEIEMMEKAAFAWEHGSLTVASQKKVRVSAEQEMTTLVTQTDSLLLDRHCVFVTDSMWVGGSTLRSWKITDTDRTQPRQGGITVGLATSGTPNQLITDSIGKASKAKELHTVQSESLNVRIRSYSLLDTAKDNVKEVKAFHALDEFPQDIPSVHAFPVSVFARLSQKSNNSVRFVENKMTTTFPFLVLRNRLHSVNLSVGGKNTKLEQLYLNSDRDRGNMKMIVTEDNSPYFLLNIKYRDVVDVSAGTGECPLTYTFFVGTKTKQYNKEVKAHKSVLNNLYRKKKNEIENINSLERGGNKVALPCHNVYPYLKHIEKHDKVEALHVTYLPQDAKPRSVALLRQGKYWALYSQSKNGGICKYDMLNKNNAGSEEIPDTKKLEFAKQMLISLEAANKHHSGEQEFFGTFYGTFSKKDEVFTDAVDSAEASAAVVPEPELAALNPIIQRDFFVRSFYQAKEMYKPWKDDDKINCDSGAHFFGTSWGADAFTRHVCPVNKKTGLEDQTLEPKTGIVKRTLTKSIRDKLNLTEVQEPSKTNTFKKCWYCGNDPCRLTYSSLHKLITL